MYLMFWLLLYNKVECVRKEEVIGEYSLSTARNKQFIHTNSYIYFLLTLHNTFQMPFSCVFTTYMLRILSLQTFGLCFTNFMNSYGP